MAKILVVDDEVKILKMVSDYLEAVGFEVTGASDGITGLKTFRESNFDLIVLDFMMPGIDGIDVIRRIREESAIPIVMLTARAEENDKLMGLEIGADDYIVKPFSMKELAARIRAVLRRAGKGGELNINSAEIIKYSNLEMNTVKRSLTRDGVAIDLTMVQFELLKALLLSPGRVFTRSDLLGVLQEASYESYERTIDVHIKNIRKVVEPVPSEPQYIMTVWGVGYKLAEE
ncbi:MAG: DNA-binding response regulator [Spirochaetes bacterium]|nr:MAG: DNA-binding response regulator [Spirochaetota bacterium]